MRFALFYYMQSSECHKNKNFVPCYFYAKFSKTIFITLIISILNFINCKKVFQNENLLINF